MTARFSHKNLSYYNAIIVLFQSCTLIYLREMQKLASDDHKIPPGLHCLRCTSTSNMYMINDFLKGDRGVP